MFLDLHECVFKRKGIKTERLVGVVKVLHSIVIRNRVGVGRECMTNIGNCKGLKEMWNEYDCLQSLIEIHMRSSCPRQNQCI